MCAANAGKSQLQCKMKLACLEQTAVPSAQAVGIVETDIGGDAMSAELEGTSGEVVCRISVALSAGSVETAFVDSEIG
jgi:uncharacterized membrane protein YkoI